MIFGVGLSASLRIEPFHHEEYTGMAISDQTRPPLEDEPVDSSKSPTEERPTSSAPLRNDWSSLGKWLQSSWRRFTSWTKVDGASWRRRILSPLGIGVIAVLVTLGLVSYALLGVDSGPASSANSGSHQMGSMSTSTSNVPNATAQYGNQPAKYVLDSDGAKHFTMTAKQVMWEVTKGHRVLAWTFDGMVPGPQIRVTAGDHVRVTINNQFPEPTTVHFHGLQIPSKADGVPGVGQDPIATGKSYTYDFTVVDSDAGTHWYHSHYDDLRQVAGGFYGAFVVDPRPGSEQAKQVAYADQETTVFISELGGNYVMNGKSFPDTQTIDVKHGQVAKMRLINSGELLHPMHLHGHYFTVVAEGGHALSAPVDKDTLTLAPGETYDVTFKAWAQTGDVYPFHCHILSHVMNPGQNMDEMGGLIMLVRYV
jgi:FtsP/CotA-like multicopper oxidase with cupredoxin domain